MKITDEQKNSLFWLLNEDYLITDKMISGLTEQQAKELIDGAIANDRSVMRKYFIFEKKKNRHNRLRMPFDEPTPK